MEIVDLKSKIEPKKTAAESEVEPLPPDFEISAIDDDEEKEASRIDSKINAESRPSPSQTIEVDFATFTELISSPKVQEIITENRSAKITLSANLLTRLASAQEAKNSNKVSIIFCVGLIIGVIFTWILLTQ